MAVMRVEKNGNYTVMSNYHLRDPRLSLKAKGLLSVMLSLPVEWDFTLAGLACISKEGIDAIRAAVNELVKAGYIIRAKVRNSAGQLVDMEYTIYELPQNEGQKDQSPVTASADERQADSGSAPTSDQPTLGKPILENPMSDYPTSGKPTSGYPTLENPTQLNTDRLTTDPKKKEKKTTDTSNPDQSNTDPSIPEPDRRNAESVPFEKPETAAIQPDAKPPLVVSREEAAAAVHLGQPEALTVQQRYMTEETSVPGMRRRLSFEKFVQKVKNQIDYWDLIDETNKDEIDNIVSIMVEVLSTQCEFFTISGKKYPAELVHQRYSQITIHDVEYALGCFHKCCSDIRNIKQYLIAVLFNAPATRDSYYGAAVRRDFDWMRR